MQTDFWSLLTSQSSITDLVGTRIYWSEAKQGKQRPLIVLHLISEISEYTVAGTVDLESSLVQVDCWGNTLTDALAVSEAVKAVLSGYKGTVGDTTFQGVFKESERQDFSKPGNGEEKFHRVSSDYQVWHA